MVPAGISAFGRHGQKKNCFHFLKALGNPGHPVLLIVQPSFPMGQLFTQPDTDPSWSLIKETGWARPVKTFTPRKSSFAT